MLVKKLLFVFAVVLGLVAASASGMSTTTRTYINNCGKPVRKPAKIVIACADGNYYLSGLKWSGWAHRSATATGTANLNDCKPNCAGGKFHSYPITAKASKRVRCHGHRAYTRLVITIPRRSQRGFRAPTLTHSPAV